MASLIQRAQALDPAGMLEAEQQFRRIIGYNDLAKLAARVERDVTLPQPNTVQTEESAIVAAAQPHHTRTATEVTGKRSPE